MLAGVIHLPPLPGSPRADASTSAIAERAAADARILAEAGYDAVIVENFGDAPFFATRVPPITVAAMTVCALAVRAAAPKLALGVNVLRNDGEAALAVAAACDAAFVRINVLIGARVTDQGVIEGDAATLLRSRRAIGAEAVKVWADVDVKHSSPLGPPRPVEQELADLVQRACADVVLVTGSGTGKGVDIAQLAAVKAATAQPVLVASGATVDSLPSLAAHSNGVIVGTALRAGNVPGRPIDVTLANSFATAFRAAYR